MKLVNAKIKPPEHLPPQCCQQYAKETRKDYGGRILILDLDNSTDDHIHCNYCKACKGIVHGVTIIDGNDDEKGCFVPLFLFDIDEGPVN